jgi:hypothetical protein
VRLSVNRRSIAVVLGAAVATLAACSDSSPTEPTGGTINPIVSHAGFDISIYPGEAAMRAWKAPASPYEWVGYYLLAPCHRDGSWMGTRPTVAGLGWGMAAIYVGQQDWSQISAQAGDGLGLGGPVSNAASSALVTCSASLLTTSQGEAEAADAVDKLRSEGFADQSIVFLDVEFVRTVTPALLDYYRAWIRGVLADRGYRPGVYAAKTNAPTLYTVALEEFRAAGRADAPPFWIASSTGFSIARRPTDVGLDFARVWQGMFEVRQAFGGVALTIDVDIASSASPSAP